MNIILLCLFIPREINHIKGKLYLVSWQYVKIVVDTVRTLTGAAVVESPFPKTVKQ
jgi:hypothetical protein